MAQPYTYTDRELVRIRTPNGSEISFNEQQSERIREELRIARNTLPTKMLDAAISTICMLWAMSTLPGNNITR